MASGSELIVRITGKNDLGHSLDSAGSQVESFGSKLDAFGQRFGRAFIAGGAAAGTAGLALTRLADEGKQATGQLQQAIENSGNSFDLFAPRIGAVSEKLIKLGHDDEATARSLATLTTATQDPTKALDLMGLAADIAASRHISLESAADKLAKMQSGNTRIFKEFGITLSANATEAERNAAVTELMSRVQGQAAVQADTFGNKLEVAKIRLGNFAESIGSTLGPALTIAGPLVSGFGAILQSGLIGKIGPAIASMGAFASSMIASGLAAASAAIPVIIAWAPVILTIAAIGAAAFLLYKHWDTVFGFIKDIAGSVADFVTNNLELVAAAVLLPLAPLILLVTHWDEAWGFIRNITGAALSWLVNTITGGVATVVGIWFSLPGRAADAMSSLGGLIVGVAAQALSAMWDAVADGVADVVGEVGTLPGRALDALGDIGSFLYSAGADLIRGLINGIKSMAGAAANAALNVVKGAVNVAKSFLGIGSPSKLFMGYGLNIGQGLVRGMGRSEGMVSHAAGSLVGATVPSALGTGATTGLGYAGGSSASTGAEAIAAAVAAAMAPLIERLRQAGMTNVFPPGTDPLHIAREIAWAMG